MESRISSATYFNQGLAGMTTTQTAIAKAMQEISTGQRDVRASMDPIAAASVVELDRSVSRLQQFQRNANVADNRLGQTENTLKSMNDALSRARELAIQFNNGVNDDVSRAAMREEFGQLRDQMLNLLNSQDERGDYLFSGSQVNTAPYASAVSAFAGDTLGLNISVADGRTVQAGWTAEGFQGVLQTLEDMASDTSLTTVDTARFDSLVQAQDLAIVLRAEVGSSMNAVSMARTDNEGELYGYTSTLSALRDTDYASAITELNKQTLVLQATQSTLARVQGLSLFNEI